MTTEDKKAHAAGIDVGQPAVPTVDWDDSKMRSTYANVVNAASTREEVTLFFGTNKTWNAPQDGEVTIELSDRIILTPFAAKRLMMLLSALVKQYEDRYGTLDLGQPPPPPPAAPPAE